MKPYPAIAPAKKKQNASSTKQRKSANVRFIPLRVGEAGEGLTR
jgi:hypothetical protein